MFSNVSKMFLVTVLIASTTLFAFQPLLEAPSASPPISLPLAAVNGPQKTIVILVKFTDQGNTTTPNSVNSMFSKMNNYYSEDSYGTTSFQTTLTPGNSAWYTMPLTMVTYGQDSAQSDNQLVQDGLQAAYNTGVDLSQYKFATIVHAGNDEAKTHSFSDIHSFTIQDYIFQTSPITSVRISTSVVAETDPLGVFAHESGHLLGLPDLYDLTGTIDPTNNFLGYWEIMALGEWNPNGWPTGTPLANPGDYPSLHSAWAKIQLGWIPSLLIQTIQTGTAANITIHDLEQAVSSGVQAVKIPIAYNSDGKMSYYLVEMRAKLGTYDQDLPFPATYPGAGLLIYSVNESITPGHGSVRLIDAHPGGNLDDAPFGPCTSPCTSNNTFWDQQNYVKIIIGNTTPTDFEITVDRTAAPALLLQINIRPGTQGVLISVDGINTTSDSTGEVRLPVRWGPHSIYVQPKIPLAIGSSTINLGLMNGFSAWDDGSTSNPRGTSINKDTVLTAIYQITIEPTTSTWFIAVGLLSVILAIAVVHHRRRNARQQQRLYHQQSLTTTPSGPQISSPTQVAGGPGSLPGYHSLPEQSVEDGERTNSS